MGCQSDFCAWKDDAFGRYFPDTFEALEALGAELVEFSPIRDETLPESVDLVMIGCGFPDHYADALAANLSLIAALRSHVCRGQRIYSEGGGTAYLGRSMILGDRQVPGAGILPFDAELRRDIADGIEQADCGELSPFDPRATLARIRSRQATSAAGQP